MNNRQYGGLDWGRMAAALLVIAIHTSPLTAYSAEADWFFTRVLARTAVPLFFIISGFFLLPAYLFTDKPDEQAQKRIRKFFLKNGRLYFAAVLLYLPLGFYAGLYQHCCHARIGCGFCCWMAPSIISGIFRAVLTRGDAALFSASMAVAGPTNRIGAAFIQAQDFWATAITGWRSSCRGCLLPFIRCSFRSVLTLATVFLWRQSFC